MTPGKLFFTIAPARAGKSTFANRWVCYQDEASMGRPSLEHFRPRTIVCADDIRLALHGMRYSSEAEEHVHAVKHTMIKALLRRGHDVLVDGTHTTWNSIEKLLWIDPNAEAIWIPNREILYSTKNTFEDFIKELHRRAIVTGQPDLIPIIDRMCNQFISLDVYYNQARSEFIEKWNARQNELRIV